MARDLSTDLITHLTSKLARPIFLAAITCETGVVRVWSGGGTISWNGDNYLGVGNFGGVTTIQETTDLQANGVKFSLSGVKDEYLEVALAEIKPNNPAYLWVGGLDEDFQIIADPYLLFGGVTDAPEIDEEGETCTISIAAESYLITLETARIRRYTTADQQIDDPTDLGFEFVPGLQNAVIRFGG
jgi:hypothetical protein